MLWGMPESGTPVPPPFGPARPPASPGARVGAVAIDLVGTFLITLAIVYTLISLGFSGYNGVSGTNDDLVLAGALGIVVVPAASILLNTVTTIVWGRTIGKYLLSLRVVDMHTLSTPAPSQILLRTLVLVAPILVAIPISYLVMLSSGLTLGFQGVVVVLVAAYWIVLLALMLGRPGVIALQDRAGRTIVVSTRTPTASTEPAPSAS